MTLVSDLFLIAVAALAGGLIAFRLKLPPLFGYIVAGIAVGPYTGGVTVSELLHVEALAEIGLALLLFSFGIEFSQDILRPVLRGVVLVTLPFVLLALLLGLGIGPLFGWGWRPAFWFGMLLSLSSLALFAKMLPRVEPADATRSLFLTGVLVAQNLLILPLFLLVYAVTAEPVSGPRIALAAVEGVLLLALLLFLGARVVPRLARYTSDSPDLHTPLVVACALILAAGTYWYGLPFVLVAFPIGLALSESEVTRGPLSEILQARSLFGVLFFVSAGMLLDLGFVAANIGRIALLVLLVAVGRGVLLSLLIRLQGYSALTALMGGLLLFQVGELALVLARVGVEAGLFDDDLYSLVVVLSLVTIVLTPLALHVGMRFARGEALREVV